MPIILTLGMSNTEVINKVENQYRMPCPANCPQYLYDIMMECWQYEPARRPTFDTLQWRLEEFFSLDTDYKEYKDNETMETPKRPKKNIAKY
jgi:fyn-related kinase